MHGWSQRWADGDMMMREATMGAQAKTYLHLHLLHLHLVLHLHLLHLCLHISAHAP
jgi:hypothetical protein